MKAEYNISKTVGHDDWRGMRLTLDGKEGETPKELMDRAALEVDNWFASRYNIQIDTGFGPGVKPLASYTPLPEIVTEKIPENKRIDQLCNDMETCQNVKVLESYKLLAKTNPILQAAYDQRYKELMDARVGF